jgi:L-asparaginase II
MDPISVTVRRGAEVESVHRVHAVLVRDGEVADAAGDPKVVTFMRSAAKPFQALALAEAVPELTAEELAIACASHEALPDQLRAVERLLARAHARDADLECGPVDGSRVRHNCSGKHAGMLLRCRLNGWETGGYRLAGHPLQQALGAEIGVAAEVPEAEIATGVDGCGVVTYALPLRAMAAMFARLVRGELAGADRVAAVMREHPELVGGPDADDTVLMQAIPGAIAKRGAEGVLCAALPDGTGFALKVEDGANRAVRPALGALLGVEALASAPVRNSRGDEVGEIVPSGSKSTLALFHTRS